jgi:hypothetical protein
MIAFLCFFILISHGSLEVTNTTSSWINAILMGGGNNKSCQGTLKSCHIFSMTVVIDLFFVYSK